MSQSTKDEIVVLGIDPGSRVTGFAITRSRGKTREVLACDVLRLEKMEDHQDRMLELFQQFNELIRIYKPNEVAIETPVYGKDPLAMLKLGRAQAACIIAAKSSGLPIQEYYPKAVKKMITGNGNASKQQVANMLEHMTNLSLDKIKHDATDALSLAIAHELHLRNPKLYSLPQKKTHQNRKASSWEQFVKENPQRVK